MIIRQKIHKRSIAVVIGLMFAVSACAGPAATNASGGSTAGGDVASLNDGTSPAGTGGEENVEAPENAEDALRLYEKCMADAGFAFDTSTEGDDEGDDDGRIEIEEFGSDSDDPQSNGGVGDFDGEGFEAANDACAKHLANSDDSFDLSPEQLVAIEEAERAFAACMSERGVDLPEETGEGAAVDAGGADAEGDPQDEAGSFDDNDFDFEKFNEAAEECEFVFDALADELDGTDS